MFASHLLQTTEQRPDVEHLHGFENHSLPIKSSTRPLAQLFLTFTLVELMPTEEFQVTPQLMDE